MQCSVIRDLLPLYLDEVCSEDTKKLVERHLAECADCRKMLEEMRREMALPKLSEEEQQEAKTPFKQIQKRERKRIFAAVLATVAVLGSLYIWRLEWFDWLDRFIHPVYVSYVYITEVGAWEPVTINYKEQPFSAYGSTYDGNCTERLEVPDHLLVRWRGSAVNGVDSAGPILMRVKNMEQELISEEIPLDAGEGVTIEQLKKGGEYYVEIKVEKAGVYRIAFT